MNMWTNVIKILSCLVFIMVDKTLGRIPEYKNFCGNIYLYSHQGEDKAAGKWIYDYGLPPSQDCLINLITMDKNAFIAVKTKNLRKNRQDWYCRNNNTVTTSSPTVNPIECEFEYCSDPLSEDTEWTRFEPEVNVTIKVKHRSYEPFLFEIEFYTLRYSPCESSEVWCGACMDASLACGHGNKYCNQLQHDVCSDIQKDDTVTSALPAVVTSAIFIILLIVLCCVFVQRNKLPCCQFGNSQASNSESVAERARAIFTVQLASRGVTSSTGNDNQAYTEDGEPIDPSTFEPPPEYSSLENIDQEGKSEIDGEMLPSYDNALENREKYKIEFE